VVAVRTSGAAEDAAAVGTFKSIAVAAGFPARALAAMIFGVMHARSTGALSSVEAVFTAGPGAGGCVSLVSTLALLSMFILSSEAVVVVAAGVSGAGCWLNSSCGAATAGAGLGAFMSVFGNSAAMAAVAKAAEAASAIK